jgi:hypothetical protein
LNIEDIVKELKLQVRCSEENLAKVCKGGYTGDLLSDVIANSNEGDIWITRQVHQNIVAVASLKEHSGIVIVNSCEPNKDTLEKAAIENIPVMVSDLSAFEVSGKIYKLINNLK